MLRCLTPLGLAGIVLLVSGAAGQTPPMSPPIHHLDPYNPEYADGVVLVKMRDETGVRTYDDFLASSAYQSIQQLYAVQEIKHLFPRAVVPSLQPMRTYGGRMIRPKDMGTIFKMKLDTSQDAKEIAEAISEHPDVEYAEPDYFVYTMLSPNDPLLGDQWHLDPFPGVNAEAAWDSTTCDTSQVIAIIDTGVDWDHPDLDDNIWINWTEYHGVPGNDDDGNGFVDDLRGWDWINDDNDPNDDNSHGTHVAGIAAAETDNGIGIAGIAWHAKLMPLKVLQSSGQGTSSDLAEGITYAAQNGATVINMSLGSYGESQTVKTTLENAYAYAVLVAAAGNDHYPIEPVDLIPGIPSYPACYDFVIGVQASKDHTDSNYGWRASFSNWDPSGPIESTNSDGFNYELSAPGVSILSTIPNGNYDFLSGTSMASPIVAGAVALVKSVNPGDSHEEVFAKLIYSSSSNILDSNAVLSCALTSPDLNFEEYTVEDSLGDDDGRVDAGETIKLWLTVKNTAGWADSVWSKLRMGEFEDPSVATITDTTSYLGNISTYATLTGESDPFEVQISSDISNLRDITLEYEIGAANAVPILGELILTAYNVEEISGVLLADSTFTADNEYRMIGNFRVNSGATLYLDPGVHFVIDDGVTFDIDGRVIAVGKPDSLIEFTANGSSALLNCASNEVSLFKYTKIHDIYVIGAPWIDFRNGSHVFEDVIFDECYGSIVILDDVRFNRVSIINCGRWSQHTFMTATELINCNLINNSTFSWALGLVYYSNSRPNLNGSCLLNNYPKSLHTSDGSSIEWIPEVYWGISDTTSIHLNEIHDFQDDGTLAVAVISPVLDAPPTENHGIVWKVEINDKNPQYEQLDPIGLETLQFDVYFNRPMDTDYEPFLTFGVCDPYTQHVVGDSAFWSPDSTVYTAYYTVGLETGDGINTIRVANARDTDLFEIPIEYTRFQFNIQAAGAASVDFTATPGIGKVDLEWPSAPSPDVLGYNMYRFEKVNDSTYTDTTAINTTLITDTLYVDYDVIPDSTYYYLYTVLSTDMDESNYSTTVSATPFSAATGDANGDLTVNVLDITTIIAYIMGDDPEPFLFDAADVNMDDEINVLDIVGVVNIILGGGPTFTPSSVVASAVITQYDDRATLSIDGPMAGLQFSVSSDDLAALTVTPLDGLELVTRERAEDELLVLAFSFSRNTIPAGEYTLVGYPENSHIKISQAFVADATGNGVPVTFGESEAIPTVYRLYQNYPNPFDEATTILYDLPEASTVKLEIYNLLGQRVYRWEIPEQAPGRYRTTWNGSSDRGKPVASGMYYLRMKAGEYTSSKKMVVLR